MTTTRLFSTIFLLLYFTSLFAQDEPPFRFGIRGGGNLYSGVLSVAPEISKIDKAIFSGKTPAKSLYSVIYRREKKRIELGLDPLFKKEMCRRDVLFSLNLQDEVV